MKKSMVLCLFLVAFQTLSIEDEKTKQEEKIRQIEDRLNQLEYRNLTNFATIHGFARHTSVFFTLEDKDNIGTSNQFRRFKRNLITSKIDISGKPQGNLLISSRLSMRKFWQTQSFTSANGQTFPNSNVFGDLRQGAVPGDSTVYMERAYISWGFAQGYNLTVGRLPTTGGAPSNSIYGTPQDTPFHKFTMSVPNDGVALSKEFDLGNRQKLKLIGSYLPWGYLDVDKQTRILGSNYQTKVPDTQGASVDHSDPIYIVMANYDSYSFDFVRSLKVSAQFTRWFDVFLGTPNISNLRTSIERYTLITDLRGIANSKWNLSLTYTHSKTTSTGSFNNLGGVFCTQGANDTCEKDGHAVLAIVDYNITNKWNIGYLILDNSSYNLLFDNDTDLGYILFTTPGSTNHLLFTSYKVNPYLSISGSALQARVRKRYAVSNLIGNETDVNYRISGFKLSLTAHF